MTKALQSKPVYDLALPGGSLDSYINWVNQISMLSVEEEQGLARRFRDHGDIEAARQLVMSHLRFVVRIARGYSGYGLVLADLIQEGTIGLMKAVKRFDPEMGVRLVSFAVHWIKSEIHEFVLKNWRIVKVATTKAQRKLFFNLRKMSKRLGWFTNEEVQSVARDLNVSTKEVLTMEARLNQYDEAFDAPDDNEDSAWQAPANYLEDHSFDPARALELQSSTENQEQNLKKAFVALDARSQDILQQRWLADKKATLHDLAAKYNVSAERIRQLEKQAMGKIKKIILTNNSDNTL
ncbi:MAG: RNA polymerase sigma factor RpoH [Gammaproteobacteria bacterium]|nr:RNA polymerase sigma factor RpoH [Gammaproteobacteria bacterium]